jgi:hypothetical protein
MMLGLLQSERNGRDIVKVFLKIEKQLCEFVEWKKTVVGAYPMHPLLI